jgi:hypothetical protein
VERLRAPALDATSGITLGGQRLNGDGRWVGPPAAQTVAPRGEDYDVAVPPASAALVSVSLASTGKLNV